MTSETSKHFYQGSCLCQGVSYEIHGVLDNVIACHWNQCRKTSGHYLAATATDPAALSFTHQESLAWYESTPGHKRGFCNRCGSSLFWKAENRNYLAICAGTLDSPAEIQLQQHIYAADQGSYYKIDDGLPQFQQGVPRLFEANSQSQ